MNGQLENDRRRIKSWKKKRRNSNSQMRNTHTIQMLQFKPIYSYMLLIHTQKS